MASQPTQLSEAASRRAHLKEVTNDPSPDSLGAELRAARQKLGLDVKEASRVTKIKPEYLEALEESRLEALPGRTYAIGFLRTYAAFLKLDAAEMVARLKAEYPADKAAELIHSPSLPEPQNEMRIPQGALIIVGIIVIAMIYAGVYLFRSANEYMEQRAHPAVQAPVQPLGPPPDSATQPSAAPQPLAPIGAAGTPPPQVAGGVVNGPATSAETPAPSAAGAPGPAAPTVVRGSAPASAPVPAAPAVAKPVPPAPKPTEPSGQTNAHAPAPPATNDASADVAPASPASGASDAGSGTAESYERAVAAAPASFGAPTKDSRVMLRATDTVFLRIETDGPRNQVLFEGTLNKGEVYHVPEGAGVILTTRNGGAVDLYVDGAAKGAAGPSGIALKGLPLDPDALKGH